MTPECVDDPRVCMKSDELCGGARSPALAPSRAPLDVPERRSQRARLTGERVVSPATSAADRAESAL